MVFSSMLFLWIFLPLVLLLYWTVGEKGGVRVGNAVLLAASLLFYAWGEPYYILLMLLSVAMNYGFARLIGKYRRGFFLFLCIAANLGLLGYFKYYMLVQTYVDQALGFSLIPEKTIPLPLGISFYTFQAMSYVIDVYRGKAEAQKNFWKVLLYISLFPQLIAGPIVQYRDIADQIDHRTVTWEGKLYGIRRFVIGLARKVLFANFFGEYADKLFGMGLWQVSTGIEWLKVLFYSLQIYYDFSGYSDMAIGLGQMFGFRLRENFDDPFTSRSVSEHWRRWHISLGAWFREYVYIPLGGSRKGLARTCLNLFFVFALTGLWHGSSLRFILWGVYYGVFIVLERLFLGKILDWLSDHHLGLLGVVYDWVVMLVGWTFFRENGIRTALWTIQAMFRYQAGSINITNCLNPAIVCMICLAVFLSGFAQRLFPKLKALRDPSVAVTVPEFAVLMVLYFFCVMKLVSSSYNAFIYFRF